MTLPVMPLLPLVIVSATIVIAIIALSIKRSHRFIFFLTLLGTTVAFASLRPVNSFPSAALQTSMLFSFDGFASFYGGLILAGAFAVALISFDYLKRHPEGKEEHYVLLLGALLGALTVVFARHFVSFFLGLELLSISLYPLIAYQRTSPTYAEAGLKYLVLSGASSAFLLFGMALVYGATGAMEFSSVAQKLSAAGREWAMPAAGMVLVMVGIGFKLGLVPFHMWTPDVYQGAPAPVTALIATVSKGAVFGLLLRLFSRIDLTGHQQLFVVFAIVAVASMFAGNLLALFQQSIKRLLAYSSIAHLGYLLVAFLSAGPLRVTAVTFYLTVYFAMTVGAFAVVASLSGERGDADNMAEYEGLFDRRPFVGGAFVFMLLSLAGMPLTAGFIGKIYVVAAGLGSLLTVLVVILIINSAISLFYYLRVVAVVFKAGPGKGSTVSTIGLGGSVVMAVLFLLLVWWGVYPIPLVDLIEGITIGP
jgi:NADH-quinone oxidoreductase subunit N